jgi:hypothetical protein
MERIQKVRLPFGGTNKWKTDRTIPNNKAAILIRDNEQGTSMLTNTAVSGDGNVITKETEKILKTLH